MFFSRFHVKQLIALSRLLFADATIRAPSGGCRLPHGGKRSTAAEAKLSGGEAFARERFLVPAKHPAAIPAEDMEVRDQLTEQACK